MTAGGTLAPIAISMGEPAGIGPDILLQALSAPELRATLPQIIVYGDIALLEARAARLGLNVQLSAASDTESAPGPSIPVFQVGEPVSDHPGTLDPATAGNTIAAIETATRHVLDGKCRALVTCPVHKANLATSGFGFPGHTEYLASLCTRSGITPVPVMMLAHEHFRAVPLTVHIPLADVPAAITVERIVETAGIVARDLKFRFAIASPKLAITGLNPHAGEDGIMGDEEIKAIAPAVSQLVASGIDARGPFPADTIFVPDLWSRFDCVIAMYHDQALISVKTLAFDHAVNITLGLPIIRTSPDHGTALDIAGTGKASPASFISALKAADRLSKNGV